MALLESSRFQLTPDMSICRVLNGMWQVSGGHGPIEFDAAIDSMQAHDDRGFTTWDLADHYGPAEDLIGEFRRRLLASTGGEAVNRLQALTKWVPSPGPMTREIVESNIDVSLRRMNVEALDMLQFHWWAYEDRRYLDALSHLVRLRDEGRVRHLGLTNFDTATLERIVDGGFGIVSNQIQYSLVDLRPEVRMAEFCEGHGIRLLTYGTLCGGLLTDSYLGQREPTPWELNTASLRKYKQMIDAWGGWDLFQELLTILNGVASKHGVSSANVAVRYVLDRPAVAGVIVGVRLGVAEHREERPRAYPGGDEQGQRPVRGHRRLRRRVPPLAVRLAPFYAFARSSSVARLRPAGRSCWHPAPRTDRGRPQKTVRTMTCSSWRY